MYQPKHFKAGDAPAPRAGGLVRAFGAKGVGKSTFIIDSHDVATPLFYCNFDFRDSSHLLKKYKGEKGFYYEEFHRPTDRKDAQAQLERLRGIRNAAVNTGGLFGIDNEANCWAVIKGALLPSGKDGRDPLPKEYDEANNEMGAVVNASSTARDGGKDLWVLITAPAKQLWFGAKKDSIDGVLFFGPDGWKHTEYAAVVQVWLYLDAKPAGAQAIPDPNKLFTYSYKGQIIDAKKRPIIEGSVLENPTLLAVLKAAKELS